MFFVAGARWKKRPPFTNSRSSSGTASPAYGYSFPPAPHSPGSVPSSGSPQTPANEAHYTDYLLAKVGHPHTPSKLARGVSTSFPLNPLNASLSPVYSHLQSSADDLHVSASADSSSSSPTSPHSTPPHNQNKPEDPVSPLPESAMGSPAHRLRPPTRRRASPVQELEHHVRRLSRRWRGRTIGMR
ncbi:hypothetical protein BDQ17DRAFT_1423120 [Cyathus striatus]|nr:hypothetical protein BDQ17DRAFT_1423120 [Cyathus striatus]